MAARIEGCFSSLSATSPPVVAFDMKKMQRIYEDYTMNFHPGVVMVMGHPFRESAVYNLITSVQAAVAKVFSTHQMGDLLKLYDPDYQVHATIVELAGQHDKSDVEQCELREEELVVSHRNQKPLNINYAIEWIEKTGPFRLEMGPDVLSEEKRHETLKITDTGQVVIKGRPENRTLLVDIRRELETMGNMVHKYPNDDEFYFVIAYTKPDCRLNSLPFQQDLTNCIAEQRSRIRLTWPVHEVSIVAFDRYTLAANACFWKKRFVLQQESNLDLLATMRTVMREAAEKRSRKCA